MTDDSGLREEYSVILRAFLESGDDRYLMDIETISKKCVRANIGPDYMLEAHLNTLNGLVSEYPIEKTVRMFNSASEPLIQLMMGYAVAYHEYIEMHEKRYEREKRLADELNDANNLQEMFISIMSHDIRSPLSGVVGYSGLIRMRSEDEKVVGFADKIEKTAMEIDQMIESMRTYSKVKKGFSDEDFEEFDLNEMLSGIFEFLEGKIKEHGTKLDIKYQTDRRYPVRGIEFMRNAYLNIIDNAIKYSPMNSTITITLDEVDTDSDTDSGSHWKFGVADNGDGIPDDMKEGVFERFVRNDKRGIKGSGIGLAITKHAVATHKGNVWIEDNPDGGSIFYITVPKA